jgi:hypothetical protein
VYSVTGQRVRTLVDGGLELGRHSVLWDGRDDRGHPFSSGGHFVRLEVDGELRTERMVMMR